MENNKKNILNAVGFSEQVKKVELNLCPFCSNPIKIEDFRNEISIRECKISGLCQSCQDDMWGED